MKKWQHWVGTVLAASLGTIALWSGTTASANTINDYIANQHYATPKITKSYQPGLPHYAYRYNKPEGVVVHETANPTSTIHNEITYMVNNYQSAFVHTFIDATNIINIANTKYLCWGAGYYANQRYVQFEQVEVHSKPAFAAELNNAAYYTAYILKQNGLTPKRYTTVLSHHDVTNLLGDTNHTDPDGYWSTNAKTLFKTTYNMNDFVNLVKTQYAALGGSVTTTTPDPDTTNSNTSTPHTTTTKKTVSYNHGYTNETATLANNYTNWSVYNHVKGTSGAYKIGWGRLSGDHRGAKVYVDSRGVKRGGWSGTWYRIRFAKNSSYKYWVYGRVLNFPKITYSDTSITKTLRSGNTAFYNHVVNSAYLSKVTGHSSDFGSGTKVKLNKQGIRTSDGSTWYRFTLNGTSYWALATAFN